MRYPTLSELPPALGKTGWPWTVESSRCPPTLPNGEPWPSLSIVIPSFQQGPFIEESIRSVLLQGYPNLECIVTDGGSKDGTVEVLRKYDQWLSFWVSEPDAGQTDAVCKGFVKATGQLLGIMCGDDYYLPEGLQKLAKAKMARPGIVAAAGACPEMDLAGKFVKSIRPYIRDRATLGDWGVEAWFPAVACLFDAAAFRQVGGFDRRFRSANDVELWVRLARVGDFALLDEDVSIARYNLDSVSRRDPAGEITALIALNYLNGYSAVAKAILERHATTRICEGTAEVAAARIFKSFGLRALVKPLLAQLAGAFRQKFFGYFRPGSR